VRSYLGRVTKDRIHGGAATVWAARLPSECKILKKGDMGGSAEQLIGCEPNGCPPC